MNGEYCIMLKRQLQTASKFCTIKRAKPFSFDALKCYCMKDTCSNFVLLLYRYRIFRFLVCPSQHGGSVDSRVVYN